MRIGTGFDTHRFEKGRALLLGGVNIPHDAGLAGHSDADVLLHAIIDALLGALSLGDIGKLYPDTDPAIKGISSLKMLGKVAEMVKESGYEVANIDSVVIAQAPKIAPYTEAMKKAIAGTLDIDVTSVGIKGKTTEGLGFIGRGEGIAAQAVALLLRSKG